MPEHTRNPVEISVVVRSHNDAGLIRDTLARLCAQTVADRMEILLFDPPPTLSPTWEIQGSGLSLKP